MGEIIIGKSVFAQSLGTLNLDEALMVSLAVILTLIGIVILISKK